MKPPCEMSRDELEEEVAWLRSELGITEQTAVIHALVNWGGLTPQGAHLCAALYETKKALTRAQLLDRLPVRDRANEGNLNHVAVVVHGIRHRLGLKTSADIIETVTGGYRLTSEGRALVGAVVDPFFHPERRAA